MKKLNIHRDTPEPSIEDMEKHMNFEDVLNQASSATAATSGTLGAKSWLIGGIAGIGAIVGIVFFSTQANSTEAHYENIALESKTIEKVAPVTPLVAQEEFSATPVSNAASTVPNEPKEVNPEYDDFYPPIEAEIKVEYYEPKLVGSIPFKFEESFGLREQWQNFPEFSIYENLKFQPIDKLQSSLLKVQWEKVKFSKDDNGQYFLQLIKGDQSVFCAVAPVFEKEDFVDALEVYQEHQ